MTFSRRLDCTSPVWLQVHPVETRKLCQHLYTVGFGFPTSSQPSRLRCPSQGTPLSQGIKTHGAQKTLSHPLPFVPGAIPTLCLYCAPTACPTSGSRVSITLHRCFGHRCFGSCSGIAMRMSGRSGRVSEKWMGGEGMDFIRQRWVH